MEVVRALPALPSSPPLENSNRELFPTCQDPVAPGAVRSEQQEAEGDASARLAEELQAAARRAAK